MMDLWVNLPERDRRALALLALCLAITAAVYVWPEADSSAASAAPAQSVELSEKRLDRLRRVAATVPAKAEVLKRLKDDVARAEKGLLTGDTAPLAQANLTQILRRVGRAQTPPVEVRIADVGQVRPLGDHYAEIASGFTFECRVDQLVNLLADLTRQPEILATSDLRITSNGQKEKILNVRLQVSGVANRKLVPEKDLKRGGSL